MHCLQALGNDSVLVDSSGGGAMDEKRTRIGDRRQGKDIPRAPFKDKNGTTVKECRRKSPDRRTGNIHLEWISDYETW
jgi:hypothetical protein